MQPYAAENIELQDNVTMLFSEVIIIVAVYHCHCGINRGHDRRLSTNPSKNKNIYIKYIYNVQRCINGIQMFCVCWDTTVRLLVG